MQSISLVGQYLVWHYTRGYRDLAQNASNLLYFFYYFFSIQELSRTWFSPWKNIGIGLASATTSAEYLSIITISFIMRIVGSILRSIVLLTGLTCIVIAGGATLLALILWTIIPCIILFCFITGMSLLFS